MFNKSNELNSTRNTRLLGIVEELQKMNKHIDRMDKIDGKLDIIISLLNDDDKLLIESFKITNLIEALNNYFTKLQKDSLCKDNSQELPDGTHEILNEIEIFQKEFRAVLKEHEKQKVVNTLSNINKHSDSFLQ